MEEAGMTVVEKKYKVLLSYPKREEGQRNFVALKNDQNEIIESSKSAEVEEILDETQVQSQSVTTLFIIFFLKKDDPLVFNPFIAYAKATPEEGLTAPLVYVNYARKEDFIHLVEDLGVDPTGAICICRYGKIFRGNKAREAEIYGCAGLIIFSDSADYAPDWVYTTIYITDIPLRALYSLILFPERALPRIMVAARNWRSERNNIFGQW